jgi:hypothetical protein
VKKLAVPLAVKHQLFTDDIWGEQGYIDLYPCGSLSEGLGVDGFGLKLNHDLLDVAGTIEEWRRWFKHGGFPQQAFESSLMDTEAALVEAAMRRSLPDDIWVSKAKSVAAAVNKYRRDHGLKLPQVVVRGECGAGGPTDVVLRTDTVGGTMFIISEFDHMLCALDGDADDPKSCKSWRNIKAKGKESVSGIYYIGISVGSGSLKTGRYDLSNSKENEIITINN